MDKILKNIYKSQITSIPGIILIIFAFFAFWFNKVEVIGLITMIIVGCFLLIANDKVLQKLSFGLLHIEEPKEE